MPELRSRTVTHGRNMAGARALMRASGVASEDIGKPIIAVANSFTEFVPGHTHLAAGRPDRLRGDPGGRRRAPRVQHHRRGRRHRDGPRRHALQPALPRPDRGQRGVHGRSALRRRPDLHLQLRQDHPGHADGGAAPQHPHRLRLRRPDGVRQGDPGRRHGPHARPGRRDLGRRQRQDLRRGHPPHRGERLPDLRLLLRHVHGQLHELPDRGDRPARSPATARSWPPTPPAAPCTRTPARTVVEITKRHYEQDDHTVLPRSIATRAAFENAMALDIAMGGSTNTILHLLAAAQEAELDYGLSDMDAVCRRVPCLAKVAPNVAKNRTYYMEDVHRAGGIPAILGELYRGGPAQRGRAHRPLPLHQGLAGRLGRARRLPVRRGRRAVARGPRLRPLGRPPSRSPSAGTPWTPTPPSGCIRDAAHAYTQGRRPRRPAAATSPRTAAS